MKTLLLLLALAAAAAAQQPAQTPKEPPPAVKPLAKEVTLSLQNVSLRLQLLRTQFAALEAARQSLVREVCAAQEIDIASCEIDENAGTATGKAVAKPPAAKPAVK
jgi:Spy/CpxP family protein refolding chaperone